MSYAEFIARKSQSNTDGGFAPVFMPDFLFDFQRSMVEWSVRKGRAALFEDCGMGKGPQELTWCENMVRHTNKPALILTPLAVASQMVREGEKFGIDVRRADPAKITTAIHVTNYDRLHHLTAPRRTP